MDPDRQCSQETNLNLHRSSSNIPSFPSVKGRHQQRQRREKTFPNSKQSLHPASSCPSRRRDLSDPAGPSPKRFHVNTRPANVVSNDPLQDAIDAAYFRYLLPPDHTSVEAWIQDTILAQFPDSPQSTKTLPVCGSDTKPSHNKKQQSFLSTLEPPQSPSLQAHQNACRALTKISPNPQKRKQPVHHMSEDGTLTTVTSTTVPSLIKPPSQPLTPAPQSCVTRSTAAKRRNTTQEEVTRSTAPNNQPLPTSLQPITLQPQIATSTKTKRWTTMNRRRGTPKGAEKDSKDAAEPSTIYNQGEEDILQGQSNRLRPRNRGSAPLQGPGSRNSQPTGGWSRPSLPERTIGASLQEHHPSPSQRGGPGQRIGDFNQESRSGQDKPDMIFSAWAPRLETLDESSPSDPPGKYIAPTLATPVRARGQQITVVGAGQPTPGEESVFNDRTRRQLFPSQQSANSSPQKKPTAPQMGLNANMQGVPRSPTKNSQSSRGTKPSTPSERSKAGSGKTFTQSVTLDQIDMKYLATCDPSIDQQTPELVKTKYKTQIPKMVGDFLKIWARNPKNFIPHQLKDYYESKHRKLGDIPTTPQVGDFLEDHYAGFHRKQLENLAMRVSRVIARSSENHTTDTNERHWGASTVYTLLNEIVCWPHQEDNREDAYDIEAYNIENCAIEMEKYFIVRSNNDETITSVEPVFRSTVTATGSIKKAVDWSLALNLDELEQADTNEAFGRLPDLERAFNQTHRWYRDKPAFADFEIKSETSGVQPLVQLAVWAGSLYLKRRHHNWSTDAPSLGISVVGPDWSLYVTFEHVPGKLIMMGPLRLGSTLNLNGAWEIVFKLNVIAHWGWTLFRPWFRNNMINWCRWKADKPLMDLHFIPEQEQEKEKQALIDQWMKSEV